MGKIHLVLGGTKSGKTSYAQNKGKKISAKGGRVAYIATAEAKDTEMAMRIQRHKEDRPAEWTTFEEPLHPDRCIEQIGDDYDVIILDCLTLFLTNCIMPYIGDGAEISKPERIDAEKYCENAVKRLIAAAEKSASEIFIISNYVESGLIPMYPLGRLFQDISGRSHQLLASTAKTVTMMIASIPLPLDPTASVYR